MKRFTILAALLMSMAPLAMATPAIMKTAKAKDCKACHTALPGTKNNLNDEGKKWVKP